MSTAQQRTLIQAPAPTGGSVAARCQALDCAWPATPLTQKNVCAGSCA